MNNIIRKISGIAAVAVLVGGMASCVSENPFSDEGEVLVKMNVMVNPDVTRATPSNNQELLDKCVVYISNQKGLLHKWIGVSNIPSEIYMRYGSYVAEAWSGDSVAAAFESEGKKFYKGTQPFSVDATSSNVQVTLKCTLANVVTSVDAATINSELVQDMKVTFSHTKGELALNSGNWADKCYFMMPNGVNELKYVVEGKSGGNSFKKEGVISNVQSAHEYRVGFEYNPSESTDGGAFIKVIVDESVVLEEANVTIYGKPVFKWNDDNLDVDSQIIGTKGSFVSHTLCIAAYHGFKTVVVSPEDAAMFGESLPAVGNSSEFDVVTFKEEGNPLGQTLSEKGIGVAYKEEVETFDDGTSATLCKFSLTLTDKWLNSLAESDKAYNLNVTATDTNGKVNHMVISIANTEAAIVYKAPIIIDFEGVSNDYTAVRSTSAYIPVTITNAGMENLAVQYRQEGTTDWQSVPVSGTRSMSTTVKLSGLTPNTPYEYRAVGGAVEDGVYEFESESGSFTTEGQFTIPNASLEEWSDFKDNSKVLLPGAGGERTFWDSGNHGSSTMGVTLTQSSTDMVHSGSVSARLRSQHVGLGAIGKFAAGNLFAGSYKETKGTNGVIDFGREYGGSHPSALRLWANYRPGTELKGKGKAGDKTVLENGKPDHSQIYVAFTTGIVTVDTSDTKTLFNPEGDYVLGYGEVTWTNNFGPDGTLEEVVIPVTWNDRAKTVKPTHMIIVCSASKYGDFFTGCEGSVMYVDDFELVYE